MEDNDWYEYYKSKYSDSCTEISNCKSRISSLQDQRRQIVNRINQLKTDIKNTQTALDGVTEIIKSEGSLNDKLVAVSSKTEQASENFIQMVDSSEVISKDLTDVYSVETTNTKKTINSVISSLNTSKGILTEKLTNLKNDLNQANISLQNIDNDISRENSNLSDLKTQKTNNYYNMEYYS